MVYQKLARMLAPRIGLYFVVMLAFAGVTALLGHREAAIAELVIIGVLLVAWAVSAFRRKREADKFLKDMMDSMDQATRDSTLNCPLPLVMFRPDTDEVVWSNDRFLRLTADRERMFDTKLADLAPNFDSRWLLEGKNECPEEVELGGRRYQVFGDMARPAADQEDGLLATTYWLDVTDLADTRDIYKATKPVMALGRSTPMARSCGWTGTAICSFLKSSIWRITRRTNFPCWTVCGRWSTPPASPPPSPSASAWTRIPSTSCTGLPTCPWRWPCPGEGTRR